MAEQEQNIIVDDFSPQDKEDDGKAPTDEKYVNSSDNPEKPEENAKQDGEDILNKEQVNNNNGLIRTTTMRNQNKIELSVPEHLTESLRRFGQDLVSAASAKKGDNNDDIRQKIYCLAFHPIQPWLAIGTESASVKVG